MAYPTDLDTTTTIPVESSSTPLSTNHITSHTAMRTAIIAIETLIGITASAVTGTINYILGEITGSDKAVGKSATQTLTNKTLTSPVINTPTINVGSDATGDIYYRNSSGIFTRLAAGTNGYILKLVAGLPSWAAETVTVNASTTVAGIVEEATQAEVDAGTATGATGARLFVNPSTISVSGTRTNFTAGEAITAGQPVTSYYYQSGGGVTLDTQTTNNTSVTSAGGTQTFSLTVASNSNRMLLVYVAVGAASGTVPTPTVTYNGVSMSAVRTEAPASSAELFTFSLASPSTGANNVVVTLGASAQTNYVSTAAISYYNVSGISTSTGANTNTVSYGVPTAGVLISSGVFYGGSPSASANCFSNFQNGGLNSFAGITTGDSGISYTTSSATVTFTAGFAITSIGLSPSNSLVYNYVVKSSSATPANGVNLNKYTGFAGFAATSVSAGTSVAVITDGSVTGLSSLTPLTTYFLADTAGTIDTTAGTNSKKIGYSTSTTSLLLKDTI